MRLYKPFPPHLNPIITQTYTDHVNKAKSKGWCWKPPCTGKTWYFGGIDYAVSTGTQILSAADGQVELVRKDETGYGYHVRVRHSDGFMTIYAHLFRIDVEIGDRLSAGEQLGLSGNTGNSTGPHLHFELRQNDIPTDPAPYFVADLPPSGINPNIVVGDKVGIQSPYNLREQPSLNSKIYAQTQLAIPGIIKEVNGDWVKVTVDLWVHIDGVDKLI